MPDQLIIGTDCSGLGSFEEALKRLMVDYSIAFACDKDAHVKRSYMANHQPRIFYDDLVARNQSETPYCDAYVSGFPCQTFSIAGHRKGFEDTRGTIFFHELEYIAVKKPRIFVFENVKGLLSHNKEKGSKSKYGKTFGVIRDALAITVNGQHNLYRYEDCVNYHIFYAVLNSKHYGIPQNRERIFIVGFRDEVDAAAFKMPKQFELKLRLKDLLEDEVDDKYFLSQKALDYLIKDSGDWADRLSMLNTDTDTVAGTITANHSKGVPYNMLMLTDPQVLTPKRTDFGKSVRKDYEAKKVELHRKDVSQLYPRNDGITNTITTVQKDNLILLLDARHSTNKIYDAQGIARTIIANGGGQGSKTGLYMMLDYRIRRLTPLECFRLMGYSDDFFKICALVNSDTQLYKQAGNSIVVDTMQHLLIQILRAIGYEFKI